MKKYYYLYQIINLINGKIYIGAHSTDNLDDGYFGSGSLLKKAIRKYGQENFVKITLYEVGCSDDLYKKEAEIVTLDFVERSDTYNLKVGGYGGTTPSIEVRNLLSQKAVKRAAEGTGTFSEESKQKIKQYQDSPKGRADRRRASQIAAEDPQAQQKRIEALQAWYETNGFPTRNSFRVTNGEINLTLRAGRPIPEGFWQGITRIHKKNSKIHKGAETNNFGKTWYTNGAENRFLKPDEMIPEGFFIGRTCSKLGPRKKEN
jgi:hypothetical protein